jgi:hypothetical protein
VNHTQMLNYAKDLNELYKSNQLLEYARYIYELYEQYDTSIILNVLEQYKLLSTIEYFNTITDTKLKTL